MQASDTQKSTALYDDLNAFHAASEYRRQVKYVTDLVKNVQIVEFHDHIYNHHEKYIWK